MLIDNNLNQVDTYVPLDNDGNMVYNAYQYSQLGGEDIGYPRNGTSDVIWTLIFDLGQRRFYMLASTGLSHNLLSLPNNIQVTQITFTFNIEGVVVWAYSYIDNLTNISHVYLGTFNPKLSKPLIKIISVDNATSPTLVLDVARNIGVSIAPPDVLLFYTLSDSSAMIVRESSNNFSVGRQVSGLRDNEFIVKSGMTVGRRVNVTTREVVGRTIYKTFLTAQGGLLLDSTGQPLWVSNIQRT